MKKHLITYIPAGTIISRSKIGFSLVTHYGIMLENNLVIENNAQFGVRIISLQEFTKGMTGQLSIESLPNPSHAIKIAMSYLGRPYHLTAFNCEHFVTLVKTGKASSSQIKVAALSLAAIAFLATRD